GQQGLTVMRDGFDLISIEQPRKHALGDLAVREHVRHTARYSEVVFEHDEAAVFEPHEICPGNRHVGVAVDVNTSHLATVMPAAQHQAAGHDAFGENPSL